MNRLALPLFLLVSTFALAAHGQMYQWKDANGKTVISDTPPPKSVRDQKMTGTPLPAGRPAATPPSGAEQELNFRKRQQEAREKGDKEAKEKADADARKSYCDDTRRNLQLLESGIRVAEMDDKGERRFMEDAERQQKISGSKKTLAERCK